MKRIILFLTAVIIAAGIFAQVPQGISHQAVMRDAGNNLIVESQIGLQISIIQGSHDGDAVYVETHQVMTNANGLITYIIGEGDAVDGLFGDIDWTDGPYWLETKADPEGGTNYIISGVTQFLSVPYALHAASSDGNPWLQSGQNIYFDEGNVGIGVESPEHKLEVSGSAFFIDNYSLAIAYDIVGGELGLMKAHKDLMIAGILNPGEADPLFLYGGFPGADEGLFINTGNVGIGTGVPGAQLHTTGSVLFAGAGEPGAGKVLTSDEEGNATWEAPFTMPTGSNMQTLRHDGTSWIADDLLRNNGAGLGIGATPRANTQLFVSRPSNDFGAGYANISASRTGDSEPAHGGVSWSLNDVDAAIKGFSNWGNNFSAAVAGYGFLDFANSAAVIGSSWGGGMYGALAFRDANNDLWAGYFNGNVNITGNIRIQGGSPGEGKVLISDEEGNATWQAPMPPTGISPLSCIDIDGNAYPTIVIGNQVWMAENLRVTQYNNGDDIPNVTDNAAWHALTTGAYCWYNNNQSANAKYGALYNWHAVNDSRGLCPEGWRVPTDAEWTAFTDMLGGTDVAGGKLKAVSPLWDDPNTDATNLTGFSALPGGYRGWHGSFDLLGAQGVWWSSTENYYEPVPPAWYRTINSDSGGVNRSHLYKRYGFSVRCLRDN